MRTLLLAAFTSNQFALNTFVVDALLASPTTNICYFLQRAAIYLRSCSENFFNQQRLVADS
jgi:hypothetical protein